MTSANKYVSIVSNRIFVLLIGMLANIMLARLLGPTKLGIIAIIMLIPQFFETFGRLGMGVASVYKISKKEMDIRDAAAVLLIASFIIGSIPTLLFYAYSDLFITTFIKEHGVATWYFLAILVTLPPRFIINYFTYIFVAKEDIHTINRIRFINGVLPGITGIILFLTTSLDIGAVILGHSLINIFAALYTLWKFRLTTGRFPSVSSKVVHFRSLLSYGCKVYLRNVISSLHYRIDLWIIAYFLTPPQVAFYSLAAGFGQKIWLLNATDILVLPRVASGEDKYGKGLTATAFRNTLWLMAVVGLFVYFLAPVAVEIFYGKDFLPLLSSLKILLPGIVAMGAGISLNHYFIGKARVGMINYIYASSVVLNVALNLLLIPRLGIRGAAISSTITYTASTLILALIFAKESDINLKKLVLLDGSDYLHYKRFFSDVSKKFRIKESLQL
ncbi:MAG: oligosaccharide flippase family protein [Thermodesulfobacteriota bacterium]|nr:oligosaccharide flippase family protein [Thermodesulfobacteriota bacterium]